jgi:hypothetical protein
MTIATSGVLSPPTDMVPNLTAAWIFTAGLIVVCIAALAYTALDWRRTRSPLLALLLVSGMTIFPFAIEPTYDIVMATWYPPELPLQVVTVLGRPMGLFVPLMYTAVIATVCYLAYRMIIAGAAVRTIVTTLATLSLLEGSGEMMASHFDLMRYYGNHAVIFGVPLPSLVQNAGMFAIIGVALAMIVPHMRGWRWLIVPFVPPMLYIGYVLGCTFPNFLAIHGQASPPLFWSLALVSTVLNGGAALAVLYTPIARQYRDEAGARRHDLVRESTPADSVASPPRRRGARLERS